MKKIKKALALVLALAMVVTAFPITNAEAATTAKLSATKATMYVGGHSKLITVSTPSTWKSVKVTATSSNKKAATVKTAKKNVRVYAVKAGTAKVTVKVTAKKSGKAVSKTLTTTVTVKNPATRIKCDGKTVSSVDLTAGESKTLTAVTAPASASVTFKTSDANVVSVDASTGVITGVAAGTAKVAAYNSVGGKKVITVNVTAEEEVAYTLDMTSLEVTAADTLVAKFAGAVKTDNTTLTLKRGTTSVEFKETWNADATEVTIKTDAPMAAGTYELTATDKTDEKITSSKTATVEKQKASEIVIKDDVALTGPKTVSGSSVDAMQAFAYYDVVDQYGNSMRSSVNLSWSASTKKPTVNTATGKITFERSDDKAFTYGEKIYVTAVDTKTGLTLSKELTVGQAQAVNSVELAGFIKKGTTDIISALPKDFKNEAYYMLYTVLDQHGNPMDADRTDAAEGTAIKDITFVSDTVLVISKIEKAGKVVTINNKEYATVLVEPGIKVEQGGEVTVTAIANKTGNKTSLNVPVNVSEVLKSFVINTPADIIADGESVEVPFVAKDSKDNTITNFEVIAKQATFNKLQLNASTGTLTLSQNDDGTAKLTFADNTDAPTWTNTQATDGQDRIASLTAIVVGGDTNNLMINIQDKARPTGVSNVNFKSAYVKGDKATVYLTKTDGANKDAHKDDAYISYVDQYGRKLDDERAYAFFNTGKDGSVAGTDFSGYSFGVVATYTGNGYSTPGTTLQKFVSNNAKDVFLKVGADSLTIKMKNSDSNLNGFMAQTEGFKFVVTKVKAGEYSTIDSAKNYDYSVVDISKVGNLSVKDMNKIYVQTPNTTDYDYVTTDQVSSGAIRVNGEIPTTHKVTVSVVGTYNGKEVSVPQTAENGNAYFSFAGNVFYNAGDVVTVTSAGIKADSLYDFKSANNNFARKDGDDNLTVKIVNPYDDGTWSTKVTKAVKFSDAKPVGTTLTAAKEAVTLNPLQTAYVNTSKDNAGKDLFSLKDQYGVAYTAEPMVFTVKDVKEAEAYADNNFTIVGNSTNSAGISGAERGDTYTVTASYNKLSATVKITVGADKNAKIVNDTNVYLDTLIGKYDGTVNLETQRQNGLK